MTALNTLQSVIQVFGGASFPDYYYDVVPYIDGAAGFSVKRRYAAGSPPAQVVTGRGDPYAVCMTRVVVDAPKTVSGMSRVRADASLFERCQERHRSDEHDFSHPDCPTETTFYPFKHISRPQGVALAGEVFYDCADDRFYGPSGQLTGQQIIDDLYRTHCGTLGFIARLKRSTSRAWRELIHHFVWRGQDIALWLLESGYDIKPKEYKGTPLGKPFRVYGWDEFLRSSDEKSSHFFGFESSKRSLFSNLIVLMLALIFGYWFLPNSGFWRAIYKNTVLSTVAVVFVFLAADQLVPRALQGVVWALCRLRTRAFGI